jgi:hypothetical protein
VIVVTAVPARGFVHPSMDEMRQNDPTKGTLRFHIVRWPKESGTSRTSNEGPVSYRGSMAGTCQCRRGERFFPLFFGFGRVFRLADTNQQVAEQKVNFSGVDAELPIARVEW